MCNMCTRDVTSDTMEVKPMMKKTNSLADMKITHNLTTDPGDEEKQKAVSYQPDLLAVSTQHTKLAFDYMRSLLAKFQETKAFTVATRTPQPLHITLAILVLLGWLSRPGDGSTRGWRALYVGSVAIHLGAQVWMTLISGVVLYFSLPRHEFGRVQTVLFPVYYAFNAIVSLLAMLAYCRIQFITKFQNASIMQLAMLVLVFGIEAFVRLYLVHPMLRAKHVKTQMEEMAGGGQEVGRLLLGELAHCPRYMRVLKTFRTYHSAIAMGTMVTLGCSLYTTMLIVDSLCGL